MYPKGALTHHLLKQAVVALPLVGHVRSPRGIASPAGAAGRCHSPVGAAVIAHADGPVMRWQNATSHSYRLPAQTCHRQLCCRYRGGTNRSTPVSVPSCRWQVDAGRRRDEVAIYHPMNRGFQNENPCADCMGKAGSLAEMQPCPAASADAAIPLGERTCPTNGRATTACFSRW